MLDSIWKLYNATGSNTTEWDGPGTRHDDNITGGEATENSTETGGKATENGTGTGGKATDNGTETGSKATDNLTGGKATNVTRYDGISLKLSKILMR